jgi:hypothetical protein
MLRPSVADCLLGIAVVALCAGTVSSGIGASTARLPRPINGSQTDGLMSSVIGALIGALILVLGVLLACDIIMAKKLFIVGLDRSRLLRLRRLRSHHNKAKSEPTIGSHDLQPARTPDEFQEGVIGFHQ